MTLGAWVMLVAGSIAIYGGLIYCIMLTRKHGQSHEYSDETEGGNEERDNRQGQKDTEARN